jgi:hypothetical protein
LGGPVCQDELINTEIVFEYYLLIQLELLLVDKNYRSISMFFEAICLELVGYGLESTYFK